MCINFEQNLLIWYNKTHSVSLRRNINERTIIKKISHSMPPSSHQIDSRGLKGNDMTILYYIWLTIGHTANNWGYILIQ